METVVLRCKHNIEFFLVPSCGGGWGEIIAKWFPLPTFENQATWTNYLLSEPSPFQAQNKSDLSSSTKEREKEGGSPAREERKCNIFDTFTLRQNAVLTE